MSKWIDSYRQRPEMNVRAAIINAVLASEARYLSREEVLYLAWLKADNDKRRRALEENLKQRWMEKQRRQRASALNRSRSARPARSPRQGMI